MARADRGSQVAYRRLRSWLPKARQRAGEVEVEFLLLRVCDEVPLVGERTVVVARQLVEYRAAGLIDTKRAEAGDRPPPQV
jgi:hypothetical protein